MLQAILFPARVPNIYSSLANIYGDNFAHLKLKNICVKEHLEGAAFDVSFVFIY